MNLFYLDDDLDLNAEYHVDSHVVKMPTEAAQMLCTTIWIDQHLGYIPRALNESERKKLNEIKAEASKIPIDERFPRFLPTHVNHPCSIWTRSSFDNYEWTYLYCDALNREWQFRYRHDKNHKSFDAARALPFPTNIPSLGITERPQSMPEEYRCEDVLEAYRLYYMMDKADFAVWKRRFKPPWWEESLVEYDGQDPHQAYLNTVAAPNNKNKLHGTDYDYVNRKPSYNCSFDRA